MSSLGPILRLVLDTGVYIYGFIETRYLPESMRPEWEEPHSKAKIVLDAILKAKHKLIIPTVQLVELAHMMRGLSGEEIAGRYIEDLRGLEKSGIAEIVVLDTELTERAISFEFETELGTIQSIMGATCVAAHASFVTNDEPIYNKITTMPDKVDAYLLFRMPLEEVKALFDPET